MVGKKENYENVTMLGNYMWSCVYSTMYLPSRYTWPCTCHVKVGYFATIYGEIRLLQ